MSTSIEVRTLCELRAADGAGASQTGEMSIYGYAAMFNSESKDLGGFVEVVAPGAFTRAIADKQDVYCLINHDANKVLGRTTSGTLKLTQDDRGLRFDCSLDPTSQTHRDLYASVKRGDTNSCSFAFAAGDDGQSWEDVSKGTQRMFKRTLKDVNLFDVSAVTYPAYNTTSVGARGQMVSAEVRSMVQDLMKKRTNRDAADSLAAGGDSYEAIQSCIRECLMKQFPLEAAAAEQCDPCGGKYWICETYDDCVIVDDCSGNYFLIPYVETEDDKYTFGMPQPVEKEWVPSERCKARTAEFRKLHADHLQQLADQHAAEASAHKDLSQQHTDSADAHNAASEAMRKAAADKAAADEAMRQYRKDNGLMEDEEYEENCMVCRHQVYDPDEDGDDENMDDNDNDSEDTRKAKQSRREVRSARTVERTKCIEHRDAGDVRTKKVGGKNLTAKYFAFVGDLNDTSTWKFPIHDAAHARNALARWGQHTGIPSDKEAGVYAKIVSAAKKFGIDVAETDAKKAARSNTPMTPDEVEDMKIHLEVSMRKEAEGWK